MNDRRTGWEAVDSASPVAVPDGAELFAGPARSRRAQDEDEPENKVPPARDAKRKAKF